MDLKISLDDGAYMPTRAHLWDAGLDLHAREDMVVYASGTIFDTGVHVAIPKEHVGLVFIRSGLGIKKNITLSNSVGVIDSEYRGSIKVALMNHGDFPYEVKAGERIAQLLIIPCVIPDLQVVETLDDTERGSGGLGSTGA